MMPVMAEPPFFTWLDDTYDGPNGVPARVRTQIKTLWLKGAKPDELSATFNMPQEWIHFFALADDAPPQTLN